MKKGLHMERKNGTIERCLHKNKERSIEMNYISLDLEWNQAYAQKALAVQKRLECRLRGEVIQIGAVKLDEDLNLIGSYRIIVKPKFFKVIQRYVMRLTGIDQEMLDHGTPLPEAIERFHRWCGEDFAFLTWGPDDIPMLEDNLRAHRLDGSWLHRVYDLQLIFNRQTDGSKNQRSLEYAMEYFGIEQNLPAHDALNDAYFTALVAQKLDVAAGVAGYDERRGSHLVTAVIGDADGGKKGFATAEALLADASIATPHCPLCQAPLTPLNAILHSKGQRYTRLFSCEEHGKLFLRLHMLRNFNGTLRAKYDILPAEEEAEKDYLRRLQEAAVAPRRHRPRRKTKAPRDHAAGGETKALVTECDVSEG